jgi:pimeloyl-ACP methyl ester carboxylesterase
MGGVRRLHAPVIAGVYADEAGQDGRAQRGSVAGEHAGHSMRGDQFADFARVGAENFGRVMELAVGHMRSIQSVHSAPFARRLAEVPALAARLASPQDGPAALQAYLADGAQRMALFLDVLRERGEAFRINAANGSPPVLDFEYEVVIDGKHLSRPVNYLLTRIVPPPGASVDPAKRPFMIIDPRAGHGAGIGGFKPESQVGEAFEEGHAVYFVIFRPMPEPGQTLADVRDAEKAFVEEIARRHPDADRPVVIGNCQGGWASMLLAASTPDKIGPISINGSPMAYWAGESGRHPMRYLGGLIGGATPVMLLADLGDGLFDGSLLVQNFEQLNPANSYFRKLYNLYANVDTERDRFLEFERWWGGFFMMTEPEIRWIVETLFVGNKLSHGHAFLGDERVDLKRITSPVIVFASKGDNITPPPQALNWIPDLYRDVNEIKARGQRIVYMVHDTIGHLGIFVSAKIAGREHQAITDTMRAIEALPPGLYEMVLEEGAERTHIKFAPRAISDILALDDGRADEEMFAAVSRLSELGARTYDTLVRPFVRAGVTPEAAKRFFDTRPLRVERVAFSDANPLMAPVKDLAEKARAERRPVGKDNPFRAMEGLVADQIEQNLNLFRDMRDAMFEIAFQGFYGSPLMRFLGAADVAERKDKAMADLRELPEVREALASIDVGGEAEGSIRMLELLSEARGYVRRSRLEKALHLFDTEEPFASMDDQARAAMIHRQALIVQFAPDAAITSLPRLLDTAQERERAIHFVYRIAGPIETMHPDALALFRRFEEMLGQPPIAGEADAEAVRAA